MNSPTSRSRLPLIILLLLGAAAAVWYYQGSNPGSRQERYKTRAADRGDITQTISANGTLNPVVLVNVGTQVSGTVFRMYADFNAEVKAGQVLAELDPSLFKAQLQQSRANMANAEAALNLAKNRMTRNSTLKETGFISDDALDAIRQQMEAARAQLAVSTAQYTRDRTNLDYSIIRSPISGVVIARNVDLGQTVAASFQTPTLFQIAGDLHQMQIDTSVAEADIGQLQIGQRANFTVDAFHDREFTGAVRQIRLNPAILQNVVTYNVVVAVSNDENLLMPGMTASVRFAVGHKSNVLRVPNTALRFKLEDAESDAADVATPKSADPVLYRLENKKPAPVTVKTGMTDGTYTEITGGALKEGDPLVIRETGGKEKAGSNFRVRMF